MEILSGPATLEEFLESDLRRQTKIVAFMEDEVEQMWQESQLPKGLVDFTKYIAAEQVEALLLQAREKIHEIGLARSGLKIGNSELAATRLNEAIGELRELMSGAYAEGRSDIVEELNKQVVLLAMLKKDIEVE